MTLTQVLSFNQKNVFVGRSPKNYGFSYFAKKNFKKGDIVMSGFGKILDHQTSHCSVQIDKAKHYLPQKWTGKYWNHSCDPNSYMHTRPDGFPNLIALKTIPKDSEITYSYWMSEYAWSPKADEVHVICKCGSKKCKKKILSFSQLNTRDKDHLVTKKLCEKYLCTLWNSSIKKIIKV